MLIADVALAFAEFAEAVEEAELGPARVQLRRVGRERFVERAEHRLLLVLDLDRAQRRLGCGLVDGRDRLHRLPREAHAVKRDDRAVLDRVSVVGLDVVQVRAGQDRGDAFELERGARVERLDQRVRDGTAQHLAVQHARDLHVAHVLRLAGELLAPVLAWPRDADLGQPLALDDGQAASSRAASRIER